MSEVKLFDKLKDVIKALDCSSHLQRHEDAYSSGIPDVSYGICNTNGWIELKYDACFPVTYKTKLRKEQKPWLVNRGLAGGNCFVLHQLGNIYLLIPYGSILEIDGLTQAKAIELCESTLLGKVFYEKLDSSILGVLCQRQEKRQEINGINHF